jgi:hypothetical protein
MYHPHHAGVAGVFGYPAVYRRSREILLSFVKHPQSFDRERLPDALEIATGACRNQVALAPRAAEVFKREWQLIPRPLGFWQLAVILEKGELRGGYRARHPGVGARMGRRLGEADRQV